VGDVAEIVSPDNARFITPPGDEGALAQAMLDLALDELARRRAGAANRVIATRDYDESVMAQRYARIYADALGLPQFP
jgi:glycosyltransferase involved in cell wall biosynthesis